MSLDGYRETEKKIMEVNEAARTGRLDGINSCLEGLRRCDFIRILHATSSTHITALAVAIDEGQTEVVRLLVEKYKVTVNNKTFCREMPLLCTGKDCPLEITKILVENGADVNYVDRIIKATALTRACGFNRLDVAQYLVEKGASINQEVGGTTALAIANGLNASDLVNFLVSKGAAVNQVIDGGTALHLACRRKCLDAVRCLVECGADVNLAVGVCQGTPLHVACRAESLDIARCLVEHGANVNATDSEGCSPLGICCKWGSTDVMRFLLENGADPSLRDHCGRTPLLHAAIEQQMHVVDCFIDLPNISRQVKIDGLELLGASLIIHGERKLGHEYLCRGLRERNSYPLLVVEKVPLSPVPAYGDFRESQTLEELEQRGQDSAIMIKEALLIWERVLGRGSKKVKQTFFWAAYENIAVPVAWLLHALRTSTSPLVMMDLESLMSVILRRNLFDFSIFEETLTMTFQALSNHKDSRCKAGFTRPCSLVYAGGILIFQVALSVAQTREERHRLEDLLKNFLQLTMTGPKGSSAVHVALDGELEIDFTEIEKLPLSPDYISLLLGCKGDLLYAQDEDGNTPLHLLFSTPHEDDELPVEQTVARMLLQEGAHLDARNRKSETPLQCQYADQFQEILEEYTCFPPSLQCCCVRAILDEKVPFHSLPEKMKKFIKLHGSESLDTKLPGRKAMKRVLEEEDSPFVPFLFKKPN